MCSVHCVDDFGRGLLLPMNLVFILYLVLVFLFGVLCPSWLCLWAWFVGPAILLCLFHFPRDDCDA